MENKIITKEDTIKLLDNVYEKVLSGISKKISSIEVLANDYLGKYATKEEAIQKMIKSQIRKCTTSGFVTGLGGFITMPITVPANVSSVLYVQIRMIACIAYMSGYDIKSDQVQSLVYACLAGVSVNEIFKQTGVKIGIKLSESAIKKIPGKTLTKINQKVGFRLVTKFGQKGVINLNKLLVGVGGLISGGIDYAETKVIANRAYKWFVEGDLSVENEDCNEEIQTI